MRDYLVTGAFLGTVAASATLATVTDGFAADATYSDPGKIPSAVIDSRIALAFEGAALWSDEGDEEDKIGALGSRDVDFYGAVSLTRMITHDTDWRLSGAYHFGSSRSSEFNFTDGDEFGSFFARDRYDFQTLDFDLGKRVDASNVQVRMFGGLRGMRVNERASFGFQSGDLTDPDKGGSVDKVGSSTFYGIGPRIGAEAYAPVGRDWGLTGSVSGSAVWGRRSSTIDLSVMPNDPGDDPTFVNIRQTSQEVIGNVSVSGGASWNAWDNGTVTAGYRLDHYRNLFAITGSENRTFHGPFLRLEVRM